MPDKYKNTMNKYSISESNIIGDYKCDIKDYDLLNILMLNLNADIQPMGNAPDNSDYFNSISFGDINSNKSFNSSYTEKEDKPMGKNILDMLSVLLSDKLDSDIKIEYLSNNYNINDNNVEKEINNMSNLGLGYYERGLEQGLEQGEEKNLIENIVNLYKKCNMSLQEIYNILDVDNSKWDYFTEKVNNLLGERK